jgi:hypothetical protein
VLGVTPTEEQARKIAFDHAHVDAPSCILRIDMHGITSLIAMFRTNRSDSFSTDRSASA